MLESCSSASARDGVSAREVVATVVDGEEATCGDRPAIGGACRATLAAAALVPAVDGCRVASAVFCNVCGIEPSATWLSLELMALALRPNRSAIEMCDWPVL